MICPKCGYPGSEDTVFCGKCGTPIKEQTSEPNIETDDNENLEKTMTIPVIKSGAYRTAANSTPVPRAVSHTAPVKKAPTEAPVRRQSTPSAQSIARETPAPRKPAAPKRPPEKKRPPENSGTGRNIAVFAVVFLLVVLIGLGAIYVFIAGKSAKQHSGQMPSNSGENAGNTQVMQEGSRQTDEPMPEEESEEVTQKDSGSSSGLVVDFEPKIDLGYSFDTMAQTEDGTQSPGFEYVSYTKDNFELQYKVPAPFRTVSTNADEVRYVSADNTAYVDIGTMANEGDWTLRDIVDTTVEKLGGVTGHKISGNDAFTVTTEVNGIYYQQKCYVTDKYIRYVEISYPSAYADIYSSMASEVEAGFVCR